MVGVSNDDLIASADAFLNPHTVSGRLFGDVAATLATDSGNLFSGVCIDTPNTGLCAERAAIAAMVTAGEHRIAKIVAVWRDPEDGALHVLPPCGTCREFIRQVDPANLDADIVLGRRESAKLSDLLPRYEWPDPLD
jgi:cytidine deaminase